jgi:hypothetical protein
MLGQVICCTLNDEDARARGASPRSIFRTMIVDSHVVHVLKLASCTRRWHLTYVRPMTNNGGASRTGTLSTLTA